APRSHRPPAPRRLRITARSATRRVVLPRVVGRLGRGGSHGRARGQHPRVVRADPPVRIAARGPARGPPLSHGLARPQVLSIVTGSSAIRPTPALRPGVAGGGGRWMAALDARVAPRRP